MPRWVGNLSISFWIKKDKERWGGFFSRSPAVFVEVSTWWKQAVANTDLAIEKRMLVSFSQNLHKCPWAV